MTDTAALRSKIESSGYKMSYIAGKAGLTYQGFSNKLNNQQDFRVKEITAICELLNIDAGERDKIFFA